MACFILSLVLSIGQLPELGGKSGNSSTPKPHPLAPSLKETTEAEEDKFDRIVERFTLYDIGQLKGEEGKQALKDFQNLPPEAIFALVRGMNKAAEIEHSCPALVIARRIATQLKSSNDKELLQYARENIGAGVTKSRHMSILKDLKLSVTARQSALDNRKNANIKGP